MSRDLLNYLWEKNQINSNPTTGQFTFDLVCEVKHLAITFFKIQSLLILMIMSLENKMDPTIINCKHLHNELKGL